MMNLRKHYPGCYRITLREGYFGQIKKVGRTWHAEVRKQDGELVRYAGIWATRTAAVEELTGINPVDLP